MTLQGVTLLMAAGCLLFCVNASTGNGRCLGVVCANGGRCKELGAIVIDQVTGLIRRKYVCICHDGTVGDHCEEASGEKVKRDACVPNPCFNRGRCVRVNNATVYGQASDTADVKVNFTCRCGVMYKGYTCKERLSICGQLYYDRRDYVCCGGVIAPRRPWFSCCGSEYLAHSKFACCGYPPTQIALTMMQRFAPHKRARITSRSVKCCGFQIYKTRYQMCCKDDVSIRPRMTNGRYTVC